MEDLLCILHPVSHSSHAVVLESATVAPTDACKEGGQMCCAHCLQGDVHIIAIGEPYRGKLSYIMSVI